MTAPGWAEAICLTEDADWEAIAARIGAQLVNRTSAPGAEPETYLRMRDGWPAGPGDGELPEVTDELLASVAFRYAARPLCRVCGAPLEVVNSQGMKMACTSDAASPLTSKHEAAGATWKEALDHYEASVLYNPPPGDVRVIALVAEIRRLRAWAEVVTTCQ